MAKRKKNKPEKETKSKSKNCETDPNLYYGFGEFTLPNGDTYVGDYCAHRNGIIWREGHGIYTTQDGQVYEGKWSDDKLLEHKEVVITYPNGAQYQGPIAKNKYQGAGTYILDCKMNVSCEFAGNKPVGNITMIDCQGKLWRGVAKENSAILLPENVFYLNLNEFKGQGVSKEPIDVSDMLPVTSEELKEEEKELSDKEWEKIIFAKSNLTEDDVDLTDCKWWKNYNRYRQKCDEIKTKIDEGISLEDEDYAWVKRFEKFKRKQDARKDAKRIAWENEEKEVFDLNLKYRSKDFIESCPPVKVLNPQPQSEDEIKIGDGKSFAEDVAAISTVTLPVDMGNIIYVNSVGGITDQPSTVFPASPCYTVPPLTTSTNSLSQDKAIAVEDDDITTIQFNETVECSNEKIMRLQGHMRAQVNKSESRRIFKIYEPTDEVLHFTQFREEILLERRAQMKMESEYQAHKRSKTLVSSKSKSKESVGGSKVTISEQTSKSGRRESGMKVIVEEKTSGRNMARASIVDNKFDLEMKIKKCVEKFMEEREIATQTYDYKEKEKKKKLHTHSVAVHTESLTGIPRELLLN